MDSKNLGQLDPKLKAAYDRVMSTSVNTNTAPAAPAAAHTPSTATPPPVPTPPPAPPPPAHHTPLHATNLMESTTPSTGSTAIPKVTEPKKAKGGISPVILIVGGIVFFAVYTLLWVTVFKIPIPFLPTQ